MCFTSRIGIDRYTCSAPLSNVIQDQALAYWGRACNMVVANCPQGEQEKSFPDAEFFIARLDVVLKWNMVGWCEQGDTVCYTYGHPEVMHWSSYICTLD